ncbi:MAG: Ig-like domain-containing protein [Treponemataceae bacterium]|nr:Ig-like domain-containing protein [Treponemataceae bacterium]
MLCFFSLLFAGGSRDSVEREVLRTDSWREEFDITEQKSGKYNVMVTAEDFGGNTTVAGPYNIYIDPDSDLPVTGITNPPLGLRVPGNLNIVGTCIDDDAVAYVELILDGDEEHPVRAEGQDFWSYYLDTTKLKDGTHSIVATGVDINGLRGHSVSTEWDLDRAKPVTEITNHEMGELISGRLNLQGSVYDGNGIKELAYSLDNGNTYKELKFKTNAREQTTTFSLTVDTTKLKDGPAILWFKALDNKGSEGYSSYLCFVDNTKADIHIFYPEPDEPVNGIFAIAGSVYDTIGITKLTWAFDKESGEFDLIAGDPYWVKEFDIRGDTSKSHDFTISATDKAGNVTTVHRRLSVDLAADKPVVELQYPVYEATGLKELDKNGLLVDNDLFLRGFATDDDGIEKIYWTIDGGEEHAVNTFGAFYVDLKKELGGMPSAGTHTLRVWAEDIYGTVGNSTQTVFTVMGPVPVFDEPVLRIKSGADAGETAYKSGIEVHPESGAVFSGTVQSDCGLNRVWWEINGIESGETLFKSVKSPSRYDIPMASAPMGLVKIDVHAEDLYGRETVRNYMVYMTNVSKEHGVQRVIFSDSGIDQETGLVDFTANSVVSGYFTGGKAKSVEFVPATEFATVSLKGNSIIIKSTGTRGQSEKVCVRVTTDRGFEYDSKPIYFGLEEKAPVVSFNQKAPYDGFSKVTLSGNVTKYAENSPLSGGYRILNASHGVSGASGKTPAVPAELPAWNDFSIAEDGSFEISLNPSSFEEGTSIVEFFVKTGFSPKTTMAAIVSRVTPLPGPDPEDPKAKAPVAAAPVFSWIEGENLYYTCYYQGDLTLFSLSAAGEVFAETPEGASGPVVNGKTLFAQGGMISESLFGETSGNADIKIVAGNGKSYVSKYSVTRYAKPSVKIDTVGGDSYRSGMKVELPAGAADKLNPVAVHVSVSCAQNISSATYTISAAQEQEAEGGISGGRRSIGAPAFAAQTGKLTLKKVLQSDGTASATEYEGEIILSNMPAGYADISIAVACGANTAVAKGSVSVVRQQPDERPADDERLYWTNQIKRSKSGEYLLGKDSVLSMYANVSSPIKVRLTDDNPNLSVSADGNMILLKPQTEGLFENIVIEYTDSEGFVYTSDSFDLRCDYGAPELAFIEPKNQAWVRQELHLEVSASDVNGLAFVDYSLDGGTTWRKLSLLDEQTEGIYGGDISLSSVRDGLIPLDIRAGDTFGNQVLLNRSLFKDTAAPEVLTITPAAGDTVNGENLLVMVVKENGRLVSADYVLDEFYTETEETPKTARVESLGKTDSEETAPAEITKPDTSLRITRSARTDSSQKASAIFSAAVNNSADTENSANSDEVEEVEEEAVEESGAEKTGNSDDEDFSVQEDTEADGVEEENGMIRVPLKIGPAIYLEVGTEECPIDNNMYFEFTDAAGNVNRYMKKAYKIDAESDKPILEIHVPDENAIQTTDFVVSGIVYDDDGESRVWYKIDDNDFVCIDEWGTNWAINMPLSILSDNEHSITMFAEDSFGIRSDYVTRNVRISLEEPQGEMQFPTFEETVSGRVQVSGIASDANGIKDVQVSIDNGNSWQSVAGFENWIYEYDSRVMQDGTHVVFIKIWDAYDVQSLYSSLINIDNTAPVINLESPVDGSYLASGVLALSGQATDNIGLKSLKLYLHPMDQEEDGNRPDLEFDVEVAEIISQQIDISNVPDGLYNMEMIGCDSAGNETRVSRNINIDATRDSAEIQLLYPMNGENLCGNFNIYGNIVTEVPVDSIELLMDGKHLARSEISSTMYFKFELNPELISSGTHVYSARATLENGKVVYSPEQFFNYSVAGPWITIDSISMGDFAIDRPFLEGRAGYGLTEAEVLMLRDKTADKYEKQQVQKKALQSVEISFDNGKTFKEISQKEAWSFRIENDEYPEGKVFIVVRATMVNGETAMTRTILQIDKTAPEVRLISPVESGRYNEKLVFSGLSSDDVDIKNLSVKLRSGDKASYEVPTFIQGLYLDTQIWGATMYSVGVGLTFFDDNVKLQFQFGQMKQEWYDAVNEFFGNAMDPLRYGGNVLGLKLLANIGSVPFSYFWGPDWNWLSTRFALGANFSYFSETQSGKAQILSALLAQLEFPRISFEKNTMFRTLSLVSELQLWSIPTDVALKNSKPIIPQFSMGVRLSVF